jgi:hypothetical protein
MVVMIGSGWYALKIHQHDHSLINNNSISVQLCRLDLVILLMPPLGLLYVQYVILARTVLVAHRQQNAVIP